MKYTGVALLALLASIALLMSQQANGLSVRPRRDLIEMGKAVVLQGAAKVKEALDHGVSMKSEGKRSVDVFGFKFGGETAVKGGFGDAASEGASENEDDLERRRRAVDVLGAAHAVSLLPQTPFGTNVNVVRVSSVSNVNNFGEIPPVAPTATVPAEAPAERRRRRRSANMLQLTNFVKSSAKLDSEVLQGGSVKTHEALESVRGQTRTLVKDVAARNKRSPQSEGSDDGDDSTGGPPKGPPRGGPPRGRGPPPGGCRGGPPPGEEDSSTTAATAQRRKRETQPEPKRPKRSPKRPQNASCRGGGGQNTTPPSDGLRRKRDTSAEDSDYSASSESSESHERRERSVEDLRRVRREPLGDMPGQVGTWFEQLAGVFVETVKKVVDVTKKSFNKGQAEQ
ncbi:uncharacterized protein LOC128726237 [Anopheles nili]|uniref:uncharacterized protein LOC128726237 n=1 Tax=Anopheles nili TaxID=185578 RepID=UPI00237AF994|nr:uncharacterized protein LOC128726237 [Anopheles nili]